MKTVLIYVLSLILLLAGGYQYVSAATNNSHHFSKFIVSAEKFKFAKAEQQAHIDETIASDEKQSIFNIEDEDEDTTFNRKSVQLTGYCVTLFFAAFLFLSLKTLKKRLPYVARLNFSRPQRYILQGALLI
jgi:uncharacterized protein YxeA